MPDKRELCTPLTVSLPLDLYNKLKEHYASESIQGSFSWYFVQLLKRGIQIYEKENSSIASVSSDT